MRKKVITIGTFGHVDHGKTTFASATSRVLSEKFGLNTFLNINDIDLLEEEKKRGITIRTFNIELETKECRYNLLDVPGHKEFIKNAIAGLFKLDFGILIIDGNDGIMEQTREHLLLAKNAGVKNLVIFINKCDIADPELVEIVELDILELLEELKITEYKIIKGSALKALEGNQDKPILDIFDYFDSNKGNVKNKDEGDFILSVDEVFSIKGRGTVVIGIPEQGIIKNGDKIHIYKKNGKVLNTVITGIQQFHKDLEIGYPGVSTGLLVRGLSRDDIKQGDTITTKEFNTIKEIKIPINFCRTKGINNGFRCTTFFRSENVQTVIECDKSIKSGEKKEVTLKFAKPIILRPSEPIALRDQFGTIGTN